MQKAFTGSVIFAALVGVASAFLPAKPPSVEVDLQWFRDALRNATALEIFEGLPHPVWEKLTRKEEELTRATRRVDGELFYLETLATDPDRKNRITAVFLEGSSFVPPKIGETIPMKLCGGFHADYGLQWSMDQKAVATVLICFGCHEMRIIGKDEVLLVDMTKDGFATLHGLLTPLRAQRPPYMSRDRQEKTQRLVPQPEGPRKVDIKLI